VADRTTGLTSGADGYLVEPVEPEELIATITALLRYSAARRKAERLARQLGALTSTTLRINGANTLGDLLAAAAEGAAEMFTSDVTIIAAPDNGPAACVQTSSMVGPSEAYPISPLVAGALIGAAATALSEMQAGGAESAIVGRDVLRPAATGDGVLPGSMEAPLLVTLLQARSGAPIGAVFVAVRLAAQHGTEPMSVDGGDALLVRQLGQSVGVALENLRLFREEHRIALTLQQSLLPERLPTVPGLAFAARYNASSELASVGGDFYDAFVLPSGWVLIAIGDVQGHSLHAATTMAELRYSLRAYAMEGHPPDVVLQRLNDLLMRGHPEETATACLLSVSPDLATLTYANAGHLPPLLISGGQASFLEGTGVLLGIAEHPPPVLSITLPSDALLVLVTDGLVERRDDDLDAGLRRLAEAAVAGGQDLEPLCDSLLVRLAEGTVDDDTALLVMRRVEWETSSAQDDRG
jgi:hypothetical protein